MSAIRSCVMPLRVLLFIGLLLLTACEPPQHSVRVLYVEAIDMPKGRVAFEDFRSALVSTSPVGLDVRLHICGTRELAALAACVGLVTMQLAPAVIVAPSALVAEAAEAARVDRPVVFSVNVDPVRSGLVPSLARPGGRATGVSWVLDLEDKAIDLATSVSPRPHRVAFLIDSGWMEENAAKVELLRSRWLARGVPLAFVVAGPAGEGAIADELRRTIATAVIVPLSLASYTDPDSMARAGKSAGLPVVFAGATPLAERVLMSVEADVSNLLQRHSALVERVLAGADPGTLPVERPAGVRVTVDLGAAQALGMKVPKSVLAQADVLLR